MVELYWSVFGTLDPSTVLPVDAPWWAFSIRELEQRVLLKVKKRRADLKSQRELAETYQGK